jgi:ArsR family transcriptional regulator
MKILSYVKKPNDNKEARAVLKVLSNSNRFNILKLLLTTKKDLCVHQISEKVSMSQSATSHQLALLEAYGVVEGVRYSQTKCYVLSRATIVDKIKKVIKTLT